MQVDRSRVALDPRFGGVRHPDRINARRFPGYEAEFDGETLFHDIFRDVHGRDLLLAAPMTGWLAEPGTVQVADASGGPPLRWERLPGQASAHEAIFVVDAPEACRALAVSVGGKIVVRPVQPCLAGLFAGHRVLLTTSRDNPLTWVVDWVRFHQVHHAVDAVVVYDNNSITYTAEDLAAAVARVPGIAIVSVQSWDEPYGPNAPTTWPRRWAWTPERWLQPSVLRHAQRRLLAGAAWVLTVDIDELLVHRTGPTLEERLEDQAGPAALLFRAENVVARSDVDPARRLRHRDIVRPVSHLRTHGGKSAMVPSRCPDGAHLGTHRVSNVASVMVPSDEMRIAHCLPLTTNWRPWLNRDEPVPEGTPGAKADPVLGARLEEAFDGWEPDVAVWTPATSDDPDLLRAEAQRLAAAGEAGAALAVLQEAIRRDPWHPAQAELRRSLLQRLRDDNAGGEERMGSTGVGR